MVIIDKLFGYKCNICNKIRTRRTLKDGRHICHSCELKMKADKEHKKRCPACLTEMKKEIIEGIIIDRCQDCKGVWLDKGELEKMSDMATSDSSSSLLLGLSTGMALSSSMHSHHYLQSR